MYAQLHAMPNIWTFAYTVTSSILFAIDSKYNCEQSKQLRSINIPVMQKTGKMLQGL